MKNLDEIYKTVNAAADKKAAEIENLQTQIEMAEQSISAANDEMTRAADAQDVNAYTAGKADRQSATDAKEMYTSRLERLTVKPSLTDSEYEQAKQDAEKAAGVIVQADEKRLMELTDQMQEIKADLQATAKKVDAITRAAFEQAYPTKDCKTETGAHPAWYGYRGAGDAIEWAARAADSNIYKDMKRGKDK